MKIEKKECAPTDMQRWFINGIAMVFDGGVGRSTTPMMDCRSSIWKWNHKCAFTDSASWRSLGIPGAVATPLCSSDELISDLVNFGSWQGDAVDLPSLDRNLSGGPLEAWRDWGEDC